MTLRTRADGEKVILLRSDTRYIQGGSEVEASELKVNTRVYIRAGHTLERQVEAYQVMWGEILPRR